MWGVWGSLFSFVTICPEVVERPFDRLTVLSNVEGLDNSAYYEAAPQTMSPQREVLLCLSSERYPLWGGNRLGRLLGVKLKRDPHVPLLICNRDFDT